MVFAPLCLSFYWDITVFRGAGALSPERAPERVPKNIFLEDAGVKVGKGSPVVGGFPHEVFKKRGANILLAFGRRSFTDLCHNSLQFYGGSLS